MLECANFFVVAFWDSCNPPKRSLLIFTLKSSLFRTEGVAFKLFGKPLIDFAFVKHVDSNDFYLLLDERCRESKYGFYERMIIRDNFSKIWDKRCCRRRRSSSFFTISLRLRLVCGGFFFQERSLPDYK